MCATNPKICIRTGALIVLAALLLGPVGTTARSSVEPLSRQEWDGCLEWLHALEQENSLVTEQGIEPAHALFPFGVSSVPESDPVPYRHLTIAKALAVLEGQFPDPEASTGLKPLIALANARNYVHVAEFDTALIWFDSAARLDTQGEFAQELAEETLLTAMAADDSVRVRRELGHCDSGLDVTHRSLAVPGLRWALTSGDTLLLRNVCDLVLAAPGDRSGKESYWLARGYHHLGRIQTTYSILRNLVKGGGLSLGLIPEDRTWVLTTLADLSLRLGLEVQARRLYSAMMESPLENVNLWATYQLAGMDMNEGNYLAAGTGFGSVCRARVEGAWHDQACALAKVTEELERIRREGKPYGADRFSTR